MWLSLGSGGPVSVGFLAALLNENNDFLIIGGRKFHGLQPLRVGAPRETSIAREVCHQLFLLFRNARLEDLKSPRFVNLRVSRSKVPSSLCPRGLRR